MIVEEVDVMAFYECWEDGSRGSMSKNDVISFQSTYQKLWGTKEQISRKWVLALNGWVTYGLQHELAWIHRNWRGKEVSC
ncbi:hypothetical protein Ancab_014346 [Ancistrocladus abbreviatus]